MEIELLGSPGIRVGGTPRKVVGRQRALLGVLALHAPRPVSTTRLIDALWGDDLPADPSNALQQRISELRKSVDPERRGDVLVATGGGYALQVADEQIDARRFAALAAQGRALLAAGDAAGARGRLSAALELWDGPALDGFEDEDWARAEAQQLTELRLSTAEDRIDAALAVGESAELIGELTELVTAHPLRERPSTQLMVALYRAGRQADALEHYERTRRRLADELGVDPAPAMQAAHRQILVQDPTLAGASPSPAAGNLPARTSPVIGRDEALEQVRDLLGRHRLVTLTGPGGTGKTTLAVEACRQIDPPDDGIWLVELAPLTDADAAVSTIAEVLGVHTGGLGSAGVDDHTLAAAVTARSLLLVLDNCEHVLERVTPLVDRLLATAPGLQVLATSREPLGAVGEAVWSVPALGLPAADATAVEEVAAAPAVRLLLDRAGRHDATFELTDENAAAAVRVVRRLDGIPLAIELAAARVRVLSLPELADRLADRFTLLVSRSRGAPSRQRTLRGALDWSWDLLDHAQRVAWAALSVPAGWFDEALAGRLLDAATLEEHPLDVLADLVDRSLLTVDTAGAAARYRMLETIREYGREQLVALPTGDAVRARHADVVEAALTACHTATDPAAFGVDLDGLGRWLDEARAALQWAAHVEDRARIQRLAGRLGWLWLLRGLAAEGDAWLGRGFAAAPEALNPADVDPDAALWAACLRIVTAPDEADRWLDLSRAAAGTPQRRVFVDVYAAVRDLHVGRVADSAEQLQAAQLTAEAIGGWPLGFVHLVSAQLARMRGQPDDVHRHAETALALLQETDADWARAYAIDMVIDHVDNAGEYERARALAAEGLALCRRHRFPEIEARLLVQLGTALHELGDVELSRRHLAEAVELAGATGRGVGYAYAVLVAGSLARRRGELDAAGAQLRAALDVLGARPPSSGSVAAHAELAQTAVAAGDAEEAGRHSAEALALARTIDEPALLARALETRAAALVLSDPPEAAVESLSEAAAIRARARAPASPPEQADIDRTADLLRAAGRRLAPSDG